MFVTLLIEIGNTAWKVAGYRDGKSPEFLLKGFGVDTLFTYLDSQDFQQVALASVGTEAHIESIQEYLQVQNKSLFIARTATGFGVQHCYQQPSTLGVDRWLTLLVAKSVNTAAIIIDAGTAITLDVIDEKANHLGGWIAPGMRLMQEALVQRSSRLRIADEMPSETLGTATEAAIGLGCQASLQGFVEQALVKATHTLKQTSNTNAPVWFTGGDVSYLDISAIENAEVRPHLVLEGLALWYQQKEAT